MLNLFTGSKADHPMADLKEAKRLLAELPAGDPIKSLEELGHWLESARGEAFAPAHRAQHSELFDEPNPKSSALPTAPHATNGSASRYRLTPHAFMTTSSLVLVRRPTVTSVPTSTAMGST